PDGSVLGNPVPTAGSQLLGMSATVQYARRWRQASFDTYGSATSTNYRVVSNGGMQTGYSRRLGLSVAISRPIPLGGNAAGPWRPYYELSGFCPGLPQLGDLNVPVATPTLELGLVPASALRQISEVRVGRGFSRRSRLDAFYQRTATHFNDPGFSTFDSS